MPSVAEVVVRRAGPEDVGAWVDAFAAVVAEGEWLGAEPPLDLAARRTALDDMVAAPEALVLVAERGGRLSGGLTARLRAGVVDLGMFVAESSRGAGIGSRLLERCLDWAHEQGAHKVHLEVWPHNAAALALYRRFGFTVEGRLRRHYRRRNGQLWDAVQMGLVLDRTSPGSPLDDAPPVSSTGP